MAKQRGFTLLELLVALAVLGLLMAGLVQGLRLGVSVWTTQTKRLAASGDLDSTDRTLRTLIARMDPGGISGRPPTFKGTARSLVFTTTLPEAAAGLTMRNSDVTLAVDESHQLALLFLPHYRNPTEAAPVAGTRRAAARCGSTGFGVLAGFRERMATGMARGNTAETDPYPDRVP